MNCKHIYDINTMKRFMFNNNKLDIIVDENFEPLFNSKDIVKILKYSDFDETIKKYVDIQDIKVLDEKNIIYINKSGLCSLILFSSNKEESILFNKWTKETLFPTIINDIENILKEKIKKLTKQLEEQILINKQKEIQIQKKIQSRNIFLL